MKVWYNISVKEREVKTMAKLNVSDKRTASKKRVTFADVPVGEVFEDEDNILCIKVDDGHCLYMNEDNKWDIAAYYEEDVVFPLRATLTIEGRE